MSKQRNNRRDASRRRLAAYLAAGAGSIGVVSATEAGVVSIDLTSAGFNIDGLNAGIVFDGLPKVISNFPTSLFNPCLSVGNSRHFIGLYGYSAIYFSQNSSSNYSTDLKTFGSNSDITLHSTWGLNAVFRKPIVGGNNYYASNIGPNQYLGFRFGSPGTYYYGYFELTWDGTNFELLSAAYNDQANAAMFTPGGGGGAVPEPASGAIAALLMGGTALRQWRKKRRQESNEAVAS